MQEPCDWSTTLWRCYAIGDEFVDVLISRDTDSRPFKKEKAAVDICPVTPAYREIPREALGR